ncbi:uncharacterized protein LOC120331461 isoform X1 [Styela clava]
MSYLRMKLFIICLFTFQLLHLSTSSPPVENNQKWSESLPDTDEGSAENPDSESPTDDEDGFYSEGNEDLSYVYDDYEDAEPKQQDKGGDYGEYYDSTKLDGKEWEGFDGFICGDGTRLSNNKVCNGLRDCFDCSDEENCTNVRENIFYCYDKEESSRQFTDDDPKCIDMKYFCDGSSDCLSGVDELQSGSGFKCMVKNRFRTCVLPQNYVCDEVAHCEDRSDLCKNVATPTMKSKFPMPGNINSTDNTTTTIARFSGISRGLFLCLNSKLMISQKQVCDGVLDCPDLSDECLCEIQKSESVRKICGGMCTKQIWMDQLINENCKFCAEGDIYYEGYLPEKSCFSPVEMIEITKNKSSDVGSLISPVKAQGSSDIIECFDQSLTGMVRARKCDGRPECLFGEDECGIDCGGEGNKEWSIGSGDMNNDSSDPEFCRLLSTDVTGFACLSFLNPDRTRKGNESQIDAMFDERRISICNGVVECADGSDEAFCPKRFKCQVDLNETDAKTDTFDESQTCDGFSHCFNGADEDPTKCYKSGSSNENPMLSCGMSENREVKYVHKNYLLDGKLNCPNAADECPPFLSRIPDMINEFYEGIDEDSREYQHGISSHDRAIDNLPLQVFLIAAAFIGVSALAVSFVLAFYNLTVAWMRFSDSGVKDRGIWTYNSMICLREVVVNLNMTIAKGLICGYFAYIKITRAEDANYSTVDLKWRSSTSCSVAGAIVLIGTQIPILTLAFFGSAYLLFYACNFKTGRRKGSSRVENGHSNGVNDIAFSRGSDLTTSGRICVKLITALSCIVLVVLIWLPTLVLAGLLTFPSALNARTRTYAWVRADAAPSLFRANLLGREEAEKFASFVVTIRNRSTQDLQLSSHFTFSEFAHIVDASAPSLSIHSRGSYGFFGQSGACLPSFLVHVNGGDAPFDMAVSNSWSWGISLAIVVIDLILILATTAMTTRYGKASCKFSCLSKHRHVDKKPSRILNDTFSTFVVIEVLTWLFIVSLFFLKAVVPNSFSDYTYAICCLVALGLNCGLISPFVLLRRKFRLKTNLNFTNSSKVQSRPDSDRIIEVKHDNIDHFEQEPLTNGKVELPDESKKEECENLVKENGEEAKSVLE